MQRAFNWPFRLTYGEDFEVWAWLVCEPHIRRYAYRNRKRGHGANMFGIHFFLDSSARQMAKIQVLRSSLETQ